MDVDRLEQQVLADLQTLQKQYATMNELADQMLASPLHTELFEAMSIQMQAQQASLQQTEMAARCAQERYRQSRAHASTAVRQATELLANQMQQLLMKIGRLEQLIAAHRDSLLPKIHVGARAVQMQNAYGKYA